MMETFGIEENKLYIYELAPEKTTSRGFLSGAVCKLNVQFCGDSKRLK